MIVLGRRAAHLAGWVSPDLAALGLLQVFAFVALVVSLGLPCGTYIQPAVTVGMLSAGRIRLLDASARVAVQLAGAVATALLVTPLVRDGGSAAHLDTATVTSHLLVDVPAAGLLVQVVGTSCVIWAVLRGASGPRPRRHPRPTRWVAVGVALVLALLRAALRAGAGDWLLSSVAAPLSGAVLATQAYTSLATAGSRTPITRGDHPVGRRSRRPPGLRRCSGAMTATPTTIAGVKIPDSHIAREATELIREASTPLLFDHSRRVFLWGTLQGEKLGLDYDPELLYVGAMFHDLGLIEGHRSAHERFEIDSANAARAFLERHGLPEPEVMTVWESIALHTTPEVPRYKQPEVQLVTLGVEYDVLGDHFDDLTDAQRVAVLEAHPRPAFKEGIIQAFSAGMRDKPETTFGTMNADVLAETVPGFVGANFCDRIRGSRFAS